MIGIFYALFLILLGIYSYSQIDLNLTLLQSSWFLKFQGLMIQLGYFNRPLSMSIFVILVSLLFITYLFFLQQATLLSKRTLLTVFFALIVVGLFSYPGFSHDIFNYIFDARIFVTHQANPYTTTALMFPDDTWTRFMRWTHRSYPYGPIFLPLTFVFYILGLGKFLATLLAFKLLMLSAFTGSCLLIYKIAGKKSLFYFALNPLIIIEVLISGHMDVVMLFLALLGFWVLTKKNVFLANLDLFLSIGIKYATLAFLPVFLFFKSIPEKYKGVLFISMAYVGALAQCFSREILPHYFIIPLAATSLFPGLRRWWIVGVVLSATLLFSRYSPYLYTGEWPPLKLFFHP